jgi:serine/threonine protein kinase
MNDLQPPQDGSALPIEEALRYAISLAELLRQMHREGTVYGRLELKDIAWDNRSVTLVHNQAAATGAYLAPEQAGGEVADVRSDIFAFGAILYERLSGRRAFPASDPEELKKQILELSPPPIDGIPEGMVSLLRGCLEKNRDLRWQRMHPVLIELKLANTSARQSHMASDWREKVVSLRSQVEDQDQRLAAQQALQESMADELRQSIRRIEDSLAEIQESIAGLQKSSQLHTQAVEGLQVAASQTDEVVEHVVEAFGMMHRSMVERGDTKVLLVSANGA